MVSLVVLLHMQAAAQYNIVDGTATRWSTKYLAKVSAGDFTRGRIYGRRDPEQPLPHTGRMGPLPVGRLR